MAIHWKAVGQYFTVVLFVFNSTQFVILEKIISFGLGTVGSLRAHGTLNSLKKKNANQQKHGRGRWLQNEAVQKPCTKRNSSYNSTEVSQPI